MMNFEKLLETMVNSQNSSIVIVSFNFTSWIFGITTFVVAENNENDKIKNSIVFFIK